MDLGAGDDWRPQPSVSTMGSYPHHGTGRLEAFCSISNRCVEFANGANSEGVNFGPRGGTSLQGNGFFTCH